MSSTDKTPFYKILTNLWDPDWLHARALKYHQQTGWRAFFVRQFEVFVMTVRSLYQEEVLLRSAALTYNTLLSLVPLLAVAFALFKVFGGLQKLEAPLRKIIFDNLAVGRAEVVGKWLESFIANINAGAIAGVGVLFLVYSVVGLLTTIEESFNRIWGVRQGRTWVNRFFIYWGMVTLTPLLIGFSVSLTTQLQSSAFTAMALSWLPYGLGKWLLSLFSAVSVCIAFMLSYLIIPNTKVRFRPALYGGIVAGLIWNLTKAIFISLSTSWLKNNAVYGVLGALPLLMLWLYLSWIIVLFGATYVSANQSVNTKGLELAASKLSQGFRELLGVRLAVSIAEAFYSGAHPLTVEALAQKVGALTSAVRRVLEVLVEQGILFEVQKKGEEVGFVPGRSLQELTLDQIIEALRYRDGENLKLEEEPIHAEVVRLLLEAKEAGQNRLAQENLHSWAQRAKTGPS